MRGWEGWKERSERVRETERERDRESGRERGERLRDRQTDAQDTQTDRHTHTHTHTQNTKTHTHTQNTKTHRQTRDGFEFLSIRLTAAWFCARRDEKHASHLLRVCWFSHLHVTLLLPVFVNACLLSK